MNFPPRLGIGGVPIGEGTEDQRQPRSEILCSAFLNIQNKPGIISICFRF